MIDFAKIRADKQALADRQRNDPNAKHDPNERIDKREVYKQKLSDLLGDARGEMNSWEHSFCEDVLNRMLKYPNMELTEKQVIVLDKTWRKFFIEDSEEDPTPKGNPPAKFTDKPKVNNKGFDDYDDDIPF